MSMSSINTTLAPRSTSVLLREARWFDLAALTDIAVAAFTNSPLYNHFSPLHSKYPSTFRRFLRNELEHRLTAPGQVVIVAELVLSSAEHPNSGKGATPSAIGIVGYSVWISKREDVAPNAIWNPDTVLKKCHRGWLQLEKRITSYYWKDYTTAYDTIEAFHRKAAGFVRSAGVRDHIELNTLAVHPDRQRMGIGARLMGWGLNRASIEACDVILEATEAGLGLYEKQGFCITGVIVLGEVGRANCLLVPVMVRRFEPRDDERKYRRRASSTSNVSLYY